MAISKRAGFACVAGACVALTGTAFAGGGDDPFSAVEITSLPFTDAGSTVGLTNQFDVVCPFSGSTSPDSWYVYTADTEISLAANTCESAYDTKLYVLDGDFNDIACNDDGCSDSNGNGFRSILETPAIAAGDTVYIVVDGWSGDAGDYNLEVAGQEPPQPCVVDCPDGGLDEGEECGTDANGGCNASPFAITSVACGDTVCGTAWADGGTRDTDWFSLAAQGSGVQITYTVTGEFDGAYLYLGENPTCDTVVVVSFVTPGSCETAELSATASGETWWFAGVNGFEGVPCGVGGLLGNDYVVSWSCGEAPPTPCPDLGDSNGDGVVDFNDLLTILANFGPCP